MQKKLTVDLFENPFIYLKVRYIYLYACAISIGIGLQLFFIDSWIGLGIFSSTSESEFADPTYEYIFGIITYFVFGAIAFRQCKLHRIKIEYLIGKIPPHYSWKRLFLFSGLAFLFLRSLKMISYYLISLYYPESVQTQLFNDIGIFELEESFTPALYAVLKYGIHNIVAVTVAYFVTYGIVFHRFYSKWGIYKAFAFQVLMVIVFNLNNPISIPLAVIYMLLSCLLYIKYRTLILLAIFDLFLLAIDLIVEICRQLAGQDLISVAQLESEIGLSIAVFTITTPYIIYWLKQNWFDRDRPMPYFANAEDKIQH